MTKIVQAKYKISRRLGVNLWGREKDPVNLRNTPPGQHGASGFRKISDYGTQLRAKQQLKGYYALSEKQFKRIYKEAVRQKGDTSENLVGLLESRLDVFVYRSNFATTIFGAKQLVSHKHILLNGKIANIGSIQIKPGDKIEIREKSREIQPVVEGTQSQEREVPGYINADLGNFKSEFLARPGYMDIPYPVRMEPNLVIEYYSR